MRSKFCLSAMALIFSLPIWSDPDVESRVSLLECKMKAARDDMVYDCRSGARFASGRPFLNSYGLWVTGDVLYWTAYEGETDIAHSSFVVGENVGTVNPLKFDWEVGYRIGAGWVTPRDNMELSVLFTRVEPDGDFEMGVPSLEPVIFYGDNDSFTNAEANWALKYSTLDFEFGRSYFLSRYFYMRPFVGIRSAWIHQKGTVALTGVDTSLCRLRNDFTGSGLRVGGDSKWFFAKHWNLFMGASASTLYGELKVQSNVSINDANFYNVPSKTHPFAVAAQTQIGLGWETNFSCDSNQIVINIGYELNYWWNQNQSLLWLHGTRRSEDLALHGLTVDIQLAF